MTIYLLALLGGALAGVINTLAGSGSLVTLPILVMLGLPANVANGTNRLGIVIQSIVATDSMRRQGLLRTHGVWRVIVTSCLGAVIGAQAAAGLGAEAMNWAIGALMLVMLIVTLLNPKRWLEPPEADPPGPLSWRMAAVFFGIGLYAGFLQAGVGVMMLIALVVGAKWSAVSANGVKMLVALCFSTVALVSFWANDLVAWRYGLLVGAGQAIGAWAAVRYLLTRPGAGLWVRRLLIAVIVFGVGKFLAWPLWGKLHPYL